jgi:hypothetical protein
MSLRGLPLELLLVELLLVLEELVLPELPELFGRPELLPVDDPELEPPGEPLEPLESLFIPLEPEPLPEELFEDVLAGPTVLFSREPPPVGLLVPAAQFCWSPAAPTIRTQMYGDGDRFIQLTRTSRRRGQSDTD